MSDNHLKLESHKVRNTKDAWWYEQPNGICVVVPFGLITKLVEIPWSSIRSALARKEKP